MPCSAAMSWRARYGPWALVTGASAGLGREFATQLAERGLNLLLVARRADRLEELADTLARRHGVKAEAHPADLLDEAGLDNTLALAASHEVGLLVNNAGFGWVGRFVESDPEHLRRMTRLNCEVPTLLARAFLAPMATRRRGGMIIVASLAGFQPTPWMSLYGATKAFDLMLGEGLAVELGERGVDVLSLCPGSTRSEFHDIAGVTGESDDHRADPVEVIHGTLDRLGSQAVYVPGTKNWTTAFVQRFLPRAVVRTLSDHMLRGRVD